MDAIVINIPGGDIDPAHILGIKGHKASDDGTRGAVNDADVGTTTLAGRDRDIGNAVEIEVAYRGLNATLEGRPESQVDLGGSARLLEGYDRGDTGRGAKHGKGIKGGNASNGFRGQVGVAKGIVRHTLGNRDGQTARPNAREGEGIVGA